MAIELQLLKQSDNPLEKSNAEILTMLADIRSTIGDLRDEPRRYRIHPGMIEELAMFLGEIYSVIEMDESKHGPPPEQWEMLRSRIHRSERILHHFCMEAGLPPDMFMRRFRDRERERTKKEK